MFSGSTTILIFSGSPFVLLKERSIKVLLNNTLKVFFNKKRKSPNCRFWFTAYYH